MSGPGSDGRANEKKNESRGFHTLGEAEKLEMVGIPREIAKALVRMIHLANENATKADLSALEHKLLHEIKIMDHKLSDVNWSYQIKNELRKTELYFKTFGIGCWLYAQIVVFLLIFLSETR